MVSLTALDNIPILCFASADTTVPMVKNARTEYDGGHTFEREETKVSLVWYKPYHLEANRKQKL